MIPREFAASQVQRIDQPGSGDDRSAVLVIVEHRDIEQLAQPLLDHEALRRADVLEIDTAERRVQETYAIDEFVDVPGVDLEVDRVDVGEALEQRRLAFHDRLCCKRSEIAQPEHRCAVGDDRHEIAFGGVVIGGVRAALDVQARERDPWGISQRQVALRGQGFGRRDRQLAGTAVRVELQRFLFGNARASGIHDRGCSSSGPVIAGAGRPLM